MGVIDSTCHTLKCEICGISESAKVLDKGSTWSGSSWQDGASLENFNTDWSGGGQKEPTLISAICKKCGNTATVKST